MAGALIAPGLPAMREHFGGGAGVDARLILVLTIPGLAIALAAPWAGRSIDRRGPRPVMVVGLALFGIAGAAPAVSASLDAVVVARALLGVAVACTMTAATASIFSFWDGAARERAIGLQGMATGLAGIVYPLLGGALASGGWAWPHASFGIVILAAALAIAVMPARPPAPRPLAAASAPVLPSIVHLLLLGAFAMMLLYIIPIRGPFHLVELGHPAPLTIALLTTVPSAAAMVSGLLFARQAGARSSQRWAAIVYLLLASGFAVMASASGLAGLLVGLALCGLGFGLNGPTLTSWLQRSVPPHARGRAAGLFTTAVFLGQFLATFTVGAAAELSFEMICAIASALALGVAALMAVWSHHISGTPPLSLSPPPVSLDTSESRIVTRPPG
jgi:MFS family permease